MGGALGASVPVPSQSGLRRSTLPVSVDVKSRPESSGRAWPSRVQGTCSPFFSFRISRGCEGLFWSSSSFFMWMGLRRDYTPRILAVQVLRLQIWPRYLQTPQSALPQAALGAMEGGSPRCLPEIQANFLFVPVGGTL